jgi:hypothetical protein
VCLLSACDQAKAPGTKGDTGQTVGNGDDPVDLNNPLLKGETPQNSSKVEALLECQLPGSDVLLDGPVSSGDRVEKIDISFDKISKKVSTDGWGPVTVKNAEIIINNRKFDANLTYIESDAAVINLSMRLARGFVKDVVNITYFIDLKKNTVRKFVTSMLNSSDASPTVTCKRLQRSASQ